MTRKVVDDALVPNYEELDEASSYTVSDGYSVSVPDLGGNLDAPPAYGDEFNELQLSQAGFEAGAAVTGESPCLSRVKHQLMDFQATVASTSTSTRRTAVW